jgi:radical SAM superfamily enzyme YgiQ (UPF0313 family)
MRGKAKMSPGMEPQITDGTIENGEALFRHLAREKKAIPQYTPYEGKPILIYLCDLVHDYIGKGPFTAPLNIGYISAYILQQFGPNIEIKLFKKPGKLVEAFKERPPNILGLSNYTWNENLGYQVLQKFKSTHPEILTVQGGPNLDFDLTQIETYLQENPDLDLYVALQGEIGFAEAIHRYIQSGLKVQEMKSQPILGCDFLDPSTLQIVSGYRPQLTQLDDIPSPYLTGLLDDFLDGKHIPLVETSRGCPYECTFCSWGNSAFGRVNRYSAERVNAEIEYIAQKVRGTAINSLYFADANFGMFGKRDLDIAHFMNYTREKYEFPHKVFAAWAKNKSDTTVEIAEILKDVTPVTVAFQSIEPAVLNKIKRGNMKLKHFDKMQQHFSDKGVRSDAELILGLPGETKETHLKALSHLLENGDCGIITYNNMLLKGSEMHLENVKNDSSNIQVGWRLLDNAFGEYDDIRCIETEQIVVSNETMTKDDILYFRPIHWLIHFLKNYSFSNILIHFLKSQNIPIILFFQNLVDQADTAPPKVREVIQCFLREAHGEYFDTREALIEYYQKPENWEFISKGGFGKMNNKYMIRVLLECKNEFYQYLADVAKKMFHEKPELRKIELIIDEIVRFESTTCIRFNTTHPFKEFEQAFAFDVCAWEIDGFNSNVTRYLPDSPITYFFVVHKEQKIMLERKMKMYESVSENLKLRKMFELYNVRVEDLRFKVSKKTTCTKPSSLPEPKSLHNPAALAMSGK